ncbi:hypothetical protein [Marinivivus vitaminiproducens]|uniref:hypothetical protein n=1 Tax=Marinivivus vitaminiproducens TaxID=3035935 RepID=UPI0027A2D3F3|nr:hypothetical protein P4R82_08785 [Geminicoccaceae bacterium SCSIO 64248]
MAGIGTSTLAHGTAPRARTARRRLAASLALASLLGLAFGSGIVRTLGLVDDGSAGRTAMAAHLAAGLAFALMLAIWLPGHIRRRSHPGLERPVRSIARALTAAGVVTAASGLLLLVPLVLWTFGRAWYPASAGTFVADLHLVGGLALALLIAGHLLVRPQGTPPGRRSEPS